MHAESTKIETSSLELHTIKLNCCHECFTEEIKQINEDPVLETGKSTTKYHVGLPSSPQNVSTNIQASRQCNECVQFKASTNTLTHLQKSKRCCICLRIQELLSGKSKPLI